VNGGVNVKNDGIADDIVFTLDFGAMWMLFDPIRDIGGRKT
jgi:hypothetical protein